MFWKRKQKDPIETCADALYAALKSAVTQGGRIRVEELISAAAAIVGEAAIAKAGTPWPKSAYCGMPSNPQGLCRTKGVNEP
jgi:hypothetical protein